ncbi:Asp23/Gls24 family envelope stress response protein [Dietzia sp.]|uniref:Asp23/Gls24 family envelope stress response protein n=1 Tax=Dietzia sp. TaxID=1871616 RepID=UPI002FDAEBF2
MATNSSSSASTSTSAADSKSADTGALETTKGGTTIADVVVSKIAGIATREVGGVHDVGGGAARMVGVLRERIPGARTNVSQGVSVEVGERQAAIDVSLIAEYGVAIHELAQAVRQNIIAAVEGMTGLEVTEVNIEVTDVFLPGDEDEDEQDQGTSSETRSRVQ